jgi:hypothetical protein
MAVNNGELYVAGVDNNLVFRFMIGADDGLTIKDTITADAPVAVGFSPDGYEMFTSGHLTSDFIDRFSYDAASDKWSPTTKLETTSSLGGVVAF